MTDVWDGIVIGGAGGAIAGITVWVVQYVHDKVIERRDKNRLYEWLRSNSKDEPGEQFRSTRAIASWNNMTEDRVRYICSIHDQIYLLTGENEDLWSIHGREKRSVYEKRGITSV